MKAAHSATTSTTAAGGFSCQGDLLLNAMVFKSHCASLFIDLHDVDIVLALAFGQVVIVVRGAGPGGSGLKEHFQVAKDVHDAVGGDFGEVGLGRRIGIGRSRRGKQAKNIALHNGGVGIAVSGAGHGWLVRTQDDAKRQSADATKGNLSNTSHTLNIQDKTPPATGSCGEMSR